MFAVKVKANWSNEVANFDYTGTVQTYTAPADGYYKLEVWGAQGGNQVSGRGGNGGYSYGIIQLSKAKAIYVVVGGRGVSSGAQNTGAGGGGATHIATVSGLLSSLGNNKNTVIIVAGGGGGSGGDSTGGNGGYGGGATGGNGAGDPKYGNQYGLGGTQSSGGSMVGGASSCSPVSGGFGYGGYDTSSSYGHVNAAGGYNGGGYGNTEEVGGGGGGYFGGGAAGCGGGGGGAGGGSGYISSSLKDASTTGNVNSGNGKVKITYVGSTL